MPQLSLPPKNRKPNRFLDPLGILLLKNIPNFPLACHQSWHFNHSEMKPTMDLFLHHPSLWFLFQLLTNSGDLYCLTHPAMLSNASGNYGLFNHYNENCSDGLAASQWFAKFEFAYPQILVEGCIARTRLISCHICYHHKFNSVVHSQVHVLLIFRWHQATWLTKMPTLLGHLSFYPCYLWTSFWRGWLIWLASRLHLVCFLESSCIRFCHLHFVGSRYS